MAAAANGTVYRDLNHNGVMDPDEDPRRPVAQRVDDLNSRMTIEEKIGQLLHPQTEVGADGSLVEEGGAFLALGTTHAVREKHLTHLLAVRLPKDSTSDEAEVIVVRLPAPFEPRTQYPIERFFQAGSLEFPLDVVERVRALARSAPVVVDVRLARPAVLIPLVDVATVLIGSFGSSDRALARALTAPATMRGVLPFDIPRSAATVERSQPDVPHDLDDVLYRHGHPAP